MNTTTWRGVFPALTTKFKPDFSLDMDAMSQHLEFQLDAGVRRYSDIEGTPGSARYGFSSRIAQSFSDYTGISFDAHASSLSSSSKGNEGTYIFNRIFLDDRYKYSSKGISTQLKYIFPGKGSGHGSDL